MEKETDEGAIMMTATTGETEREIGSGTEIETGRERGGREIMSETEIHAREIDHAQDRPSRRLL